MCNELLRQDHKKWLNSELQVQPLFTSFLASFAEALQKIDSRNHAAGRFCAPWLKSWIIAWLNAGISSGFLADTRLPSVTASLSTHSAPALRRSVLSDGQEAILRPRACPASMMVHGP